MLLMCSFWACQYEKEPAPNNCEEKPEAQLIDKKDPTGCNASDGQIEVNASGGAGGYQYSIGADFQGSGTFSNLSPGTYNITVKDTDGCTSAGLEVTIRALDSDLDFTVVSTIDDQCIDDNGSITILATGGQEPYTYSINDTFVSESAFSELSDGVYVVSVKDNLGCSVSQSVTVERGDTGTSYAGDVDTIIQTKCAISGCHNGSNSLPDYTKFGELQSRAIGVKSRTQSGDMPRTGSLTQAEIDIIACWVDDGAKDN